MPTDYSPALVTIIPSALPGGTGPNPRSRARFAASGLAFLLLAIGGPVSGLAVETARSAILAEGFINDPAPYPECHASTLAEVSPGHLVAAWFGGTRERAPDVGIWVARGDGAHWQPAVEVATGVQAHGPRMPTWNPVLFQPRRGPLALFYKVGPAPSRWWGMMMRSFDGGRSWTAPHRLPPGILGPIKDKPIELPDGTWLCPSSTEDHGWHIHFEITRDGGETWTRTADIPARDHLGAIQPTVLVYRNGLRGDYRLQAICRTRNGVLASTWSGDQGHTWSPLAPMNLPNPNSGVDAVTLSDGRQLLVYNRSAPPPDRPTKGPRYPLDVALSRDGNSWVHVLTLETRPSGAGYSYPAVIQTSDGLVRITYSWTRKYIKFVVLDPSRL